jgi:4-hydroxy-tetrahydrodipicolinate synthase
MFDGVLPALITPFKDNKIDYKAMETLIKRQISVGVSGFVLLGTTAETAALSEKEREEILAFTTEVIPKKFKKVVGVGSNNTNVTLKNIDTAAKYEPDAILVVTPYYNKPNLSGMIAHFCQASKAGLPIILYHIPGRTGQKLSIKFFEELLAAVPMIKAIKESDYDVTHVTEMAVRFGAKRLEYICGNDDLWPVFLGLGSKSIISAAGNTLSPAFVKIYNSFRDGKTDEAMQVFRAVYPLVGASYLEVSPTCSKYILSKLGIAGEDVRLPLGPLANETKQKIDEILNNSDRNLLI